MEQGLTGKGLSISQALWQWLSPWLRQQQEADDAQQGAAGKDHMMQEVALLVVELHDGCSEHAKASASQDQAQSSTPAEKEVRADLFPRCSDAPYTKNSSILEAFFIQQDWDIIKS